MDNDMSHSAAPEIARGMNRAMEYALYFLMVGISISNALTGIGVGAVLGVWGLKKLALREKPVVPKPLVILAVLLFLAYAASLIHSEYLAQSFYALCFKYAKYLFLMLAVADGVKEKRVALRMALVLSLMGAFLCLDGFYQFFSGRDLLLFREAGRLDVFCGALTFHAFRATAIFPAANSFASYLVPVLMLAIALSFFYVPRGGASVWKKGIVLTCLLLGLLLTFSRGGLIACVGGILMLSFLFKKTRVLIIPAILLVIFLFGRNIYGNRSAGNGAIDPTVETRLLMLKDATRLFQEHPWTGVGLNTYYKNIEKNQDPSLPPDYAHNCYIQIIAEVGIVGFVSFLALVVYWFAWGIKSFGKLRDPELKFLLGGVLAGVFGLCVASFFDNVLFELLPATLFWILLGYGIALTTLGSEKSIT